MGHTKGRAVIKLVLKSNAGKLTAEFPVSFEYNLDNEEDKNSQIKKDVSQILANHYGIHDSSKYFIEKITIV